MKNINDNHEYFMNEVSHAKGIVENIGLYSFMWDGSKWK